MRNKRLQFLQSLFLLAIFTLLSACGESQQSSFDNVTETISVSEFATGLNQPTGLAVPTDTSSKYLNYLFVAEFSGKSIARISPEGTVVKIVENLNGPTAILPIAGEMLLVTETQSGQIIRVDYSKEPAESGFPITLPDGYLPTGIVSAGPFRYVAARNSNAFGGDSIFNIDTINPLEVATGFTDLTAIAIRNENDKPQFLVTATEKDTSKVLIVEVPSGIPNRPQEKGYKEFSKKLQSPNAIVIGRQSKNIYVAERGKNRIIRYSKDGELDPIFAPQIASPAGLAFDSEGNLYVSSLSEGKIFKISGINEGFSPTLN